MPGIGEQGDHVSGPALSVDLGHSVEFAEMMSPA